jgi:hypothetical protein
VIAKNKCYCSPLCLFYSVVYQRLHWLMLCYYKEITGHHCYTLPLCRLDFSNDSDECPELNVDPTTNKCSVWMNYVIVHLHIHMFVHLKYINCSLILGSYILFPQIHYNHLQGSHMYKLIQNKIKSFTLLNYIWFPKKHSSHFYISHWPWISFRYANQLLLVVYLTTLTT